MRTDTNYFAFTEEANFSPQSKGGKKAEGNE